MGALHTYRRGILHTDGAKACLPKVKGVMRGHEVHKKRRPMKNGGLVKKDGKPIWIQPRYSKVFKHKLPGGDGKAAPRL